MSKSYKLSKTASPGTQHKINTSIIFNYIREKEHISRIKISKDLKISPSAVSRVVERLIKGKYVIELKKLKTKIGKRPMLLETNKKKYFVIGIDLGKRDARFALSGLDKVVINKRRGFYLEEGKDIIKKIENELKKMMNSGRKVKAICLGVPASIDNKTGKVLGACRYLSWEKINFKEIFEKKYKIPVFIENDVNLSAIAERNFGIAKDHGKCIVLEISNGLGAGIINDGVLYSGAHGFAGEIGHMVINEESLRYDTKNRGYLEELATVKVLMMEAKKKLKKDNKSLILKLADDNIENVNESMVCEAAIKGDRMAKEIIDNMNNNLSTCLINMIVFYDPEVIVMGGDICNLPEVDKLFLEPIRKKVNNSLKLKIPEIKLSKLGKDAGIMGACSHAIENLLAELFPYKIG